MSEVETERLIARLAADSRRAAGAGLPAWTVATAGGLLLAFAVFLAILGPRPNFLASLQAPRFDAKFVEAGALALAAFAIMPALGRPAASLRRRLAWLAAPAGLLAVAVAAELVAVPSGLWLTRLIGSNALVCLTAIPTIGAPALGLFLWTLRRQAPTRPGLAGAAAGLAAAGIAAFFYAAHCTDDSPLFVATWYPLATLILVAIGGLAGLRLLRW